MPSKWKKFNCVDAAYEMRISMPNVCFVCHLQLHVILVAFVHEDKLYLNFVQS